MESWKCIQIIRQLWLGFILTARLNGPLWSWPCVLMMIVLYNQCKWTTTQSALYSNKASIHSRWQEVLQVKVLEMCTCQVKCQPHWWRTALPKSGRCAPLEKKGRWWKELRCKNQKVPIWVPDHSRRSGMTLGILVNPSVSTYLYYGGWRWSGKKNIFLPPPMGGCDKSIMFQKDFVI